MTRYQGCLSWSGPRALGPAYPRVSTPSSSQRRRRPRERGGRVRAGVGSRGRSCEACRSGERAGPVGSLYDVLPAATERIRTGVMLAAGTSTTPESANVAIELPLLISVPSSLVRGGNHMIH